MVIQINAWNTNLDYGGSCYALADILNHCAWYNHRENDQALVERRLYYDYARWGYSPSVLSWEYINEYPGDHLTPFWVGKDVTVAGSTQFVPGVTAWLRAYNDPASSASNPHLITTSCSSTLPSPLCDPVDQVESHWYAFQGVAKAYDQDSWLCIAGEPCLRSEYGISEDKPPDPNNWVTHKGAWAALAANYSGTWFWFTEQQLNNSSNTPADPGIRSLSNYRASFDPWTGVQSDNPYTSFTGAATFASSWPAYGSADPHGLDSYAWKQAKVTGPMRDWPSP